LKKLYLNFGFFSKYGVKEHFKIRIISENNFNKPEEKKLYELVNSLRIKAGLQKMSEDGIKNHLNKQEVYNPLDF